MLVNLHWTWIEVKIPILDNYCQSCPVLPVFAGMKGSKTRQMLQVGVDPFPGFVVNFLHVFLQPGFVWVFLPAGWTHVVDALHVFDQLVGHFEHLLTILTGEKLTRGFMFSDVDLQVERLGEGYHTLFAL